MKKIKLNIQKFGDPYLQFKDLPNTQTPLSAANLNQMQGDIADDINGKVGTLNSLKTSDTTNIVAAINSSLIKSLWQNSRPASDFAAQSITLDSNDYDFLLFFFVDGAGFGMTIKGQNYQHGFADTYNGGSDTSYYCASYKRVFAYVNETQINISDCTVKYGNSTTTTTINSACKPLAIYGGKFSLEG